MKFKKILKRKMEENCLQKRSFEAAKRGRLTADWFAPQTTQDAELVGDLDTIRNRSRQMIRDNPHAANLRRIIQNNVVGSGIGIQCQVALPDGTPDQTLNDLIEKKWIEWSEADSVHTAGQLSLTALLRLVMGSVFQDGEILVRTVKAAFGKSKIPLALEVIEADLLATDYCDPPSKTKTEGSIRMGVEVDKWFRPVSYLLRNVHPGDYRFSLKAVSLDVSRIPASEIFHLYLIERWPQTRGIPWMHSVLRKLRDMGGYTTSEIVAARVAANFVGFITPELTDEPTEKGSRFIKTEPGMFQRLLPGETFTGFAPSRPNSNLDAFMRYMLREVAAGVGASYETLSRDYSQSNYSSSRLALLDDRDQWRVLQNWLIEVFLKPLYRIWLDSAVLCGEIPIPDYWRNKERYQAVSFKARGWSWVDPAKEVNAYMNAVKAGFMSFSDVVATMGNGQDFEDVVKQLAKDRSIAASYGVALNLNTSSKKASNTEDEEDEKESEQKETEAETAGG